MRRWAIVTLAEACSKIQDGAHRSPQNLYSKFEPGKFAYLTSKNIRAGYLKLDTVQYCDADFHNEIYPRCNPEIGDVLLTKDGANTGNAAINTLDEPFSLLSSVCLLKPDPTKLLSCFLVYYIQSNEGFEQITGKMTGAAIKRIILKTIKSSSIPLPALPEQKRIVAILDEAFADISQAVANAEKNLANARELFESYLNNVFTRKDDGWVEKQLGDVCDLQNGYAFKSKSYVNSSSTLNIRMSSIRPSGQFDPEHNIRFLPDEYAQEYSNFQLSEGDLVIAMTDMAGDPKILGLPTLVKGLKGRIFLLNQRVGKLFDFSEGLYIPFLRYFLSSPVMKLYYKGKGAGGLQINISKKDILSAPIALPNIDAQKDIVERITALQEKTQRLENIYQQKLTALAELKQSLLQKAFAGELTTNSQTITKEGANI